ncbi:MAG: penicillin acylase family protein [Pseudomonadota bacterium]
MAASGSLLRRAVRWLVRGVAVVLVVLAALAGTFYMALRASLAPLDGELAMPILNAPVSVLRDAHGVPTITGANRLDIARATGLVHAQERFFQMDLMRRDAAGEISALFGRTAVPHDKKRRFLRLRRVARSAIASARPPHRDLLQAYADGVNAGLEAMAVRPPEYLLLRQTPAPWLPEDTMLVVLAMWITLTDETGDRDLQLTRLHSTLPKELYDYLTQLGSADDAALDGSVWTPLPIPPAGVFDGRRRAVDGSATRLPERSLIGDEHLEGLLGSNNWAVTGARSKHGGALVANDMHLKLSVPNIWFRARLVVPDQLDATGVMLPGAPAIVAGSTGKLAWGFTNSHVDTTDLVALEVNPDDPNQYRTLDGFKPFTEHQEVIEVAGGAADSLTVRETIWGPVREADGRLYAVQWVATEPGATGVALLDFEHLDTVQQAVAKARQIGMPPQNLAVVDRTGSAGWVVAGAVPKSRPGVDRRRAISAAEVAAPMRASASTVPDIIDPPDGNIFSANSRIIAPGRYPGLSDGSYAYGARQAQIRDGLRKPGKVDEADLLAIALDDRALFLERWRKLLEATLTPAVAASDPRFAKIRALLPSWSGRALPDDVAYRWVREFRASVTANVLYGLIFEVRARYPDFRFLKMRQLEGVVWQILVERPAHLLRPNFASYDDLLVKSLDHAIKRVAKSTPGPIEERVFGEYNRGRIAHPLTIALPELDGLLNMPDLPVPGDAYMPRVSRRWGGVSERFIVSPGKEESGIFHMPGGQSGHFLSPYYRAGHLDWVEGRKTAFLPGEAQHELRLSP